MKKSPNILVIMSDQHTATAMGCAGDPFIRTPNLDRLAAQGMRFTNAYCPSPLCVPSRMSFMSGRSPSRNQVWTNQATLSSTIPTWAHALGVVGYDTALIGRMHFLGPDQRHGFMERPIAEGTARHPGAPEHGGPRYTRLPQATAGQSRISFEKAGRGNSFYQHYGNEVTDVACRYLRERSDMDRPFAAVTGYLLPHCTYIGPKEAFDYYYERIDTSVESGDTPACIRAIVDRKSRQLTPAATEHQLHVARAAYYAMIEHMDADIGRILDVLDETGQDDNTLVIYCSDHGDMMGHHGLWSKKVFYDRAAEVPFLARLPGTIPAGAACDSLCSLIDLTPTFVEMTDAKPMDTDGESLVPLLRGGEQPARVVTSEVADVNGGRFEWVGKMVRRGPWKLWRHQTVDGEDYPPVLVNLEDDPEEQTNRARDPDCAVLVTELSEHLHTNWNPAQVSATVKEQLQDWKLLTSWARTVKPTLPDTYVWPGEETEADLELL